MNKLGLLYAASPTFLLYVSHSSLEKWILPINPEKKKKKRKNMLQMGLKTVV